MHSKQNTVFIFGANLNVSLLLIATHSRGWWKPKKSSLFSSVKSQKVTWNILWTKERKSHVYVYYNTDTFCISAAFHFREKTILCHILELPYYLWKCLAESPGDVLLIHMLLAGRIHTYCAHSTREAMFRQTNLVGQIFIRYPVWQSGHFYSADFSYWPTGCFYTFLNTWRRYWL
jgi:hypothetical protein